MEKSCGMFCLHSGAKVYGLGTTTHDASQDSRQRAIQQRFRRLETEGYVRIED
jgi:hypothetical protein